MTTVNIAHDKSPNLMVGPTTVTTTAAQVIPANYPCLKGVQLKALSTNTAIIYIGGVGVKTSTGIPLDVSEGLFIPVEDITKIYAISAAGSQGLRWLVV